MRVKELLKTKTFWSGVGLIAYGLVSQDWEAVLTGLSVIFLRDAVSKVQVHRDEERDGYGVP
jgi:hypothetical protein